MSESAYGKSSLDSLPKVISPTAHGIVDYCHAAFFFTVGIVCARTQNKAASRAAFGTSGFILLQALLTDYRLGAKPVMSFETHGKIDAVVAASSWAVPLLFGFQDTAAGKIFEINSLAEAGVVALTDWDSQRAHEERETA
ncbi:hypothetical protein [Terriglobus aquaticus]|uniref:Uncharacterized protein n=1 Tax=Terriglobus aquaticus TaxID=940139 RepID=A0ABW9KLE0_9BACT|nr:hypothetical protein [Terriglobus aquaticus]